MLSSLFAFPALGIAFEPSRSDHLLALAPAESFLVVTVSDLSGIRSAMAKNAWLRFARDEQISALVERLAAPLAAEFDSAELDGLRALHLDPRSLLESLSGAAVLFAEAPSNDPDDMLLGSLLELAEDRTAFDELLGKVLDAARDEVTVTGGEYRGASLTAVAPKVESDPGIAFLAELGDVVAIVGGADKELVRECIQGVVDRWAGVGEDSNALENPRYRAARSAQPFSSQAEVFFDFERFWQLALATGALGGEGFPPELVQEFSRIRWLHGAARIGQDESFDLRFAANLPTEGICGAFASLFGSAPASLLRRIPRQAASLSALSLDLAGLSALIQDLAREFDSDGYEDIRSGLGAAKEKGLDVEGDVFAQLTGELALFSVEVPAKESPLGAMAGLMRGLEGSRGIPTLGRALLVGIRDPERVRELLAPWAAVEREEPDIGAAPESLPAPLVESINGFELHSAQVSDWVIPIGIHWSVTDDALVIGLQPTAVREALRMFDANASSILQNRRFADVIEGNGKALALQIWSSAETIASVLGGLQTAASGLRLYSALTGDERLEGLGKGVPWPEPSIAERYFEGVVFGAVSLEDGVLELHLAAR